MCNIIMLLYVVFIYVHTFIYVNLVFSEMYQARRWNEDPLCQAAMTVHGPGKENIFIHDLVIYRHQTGGSTLCRIEKIFVDVNLT